jgi:hypothetical protein
LPDVSDEGSTSIFRSEYEFKEASSFILSVTLLGLLFHPEDGSSKFLLNVRKLLPGYVFFLRRERSSYNLTKQC